MLKNDRIKRTWLHPLSSQQESFVAYHFTATDCSFTLADCTRNVRLHDWYDTTKQVRSAINKYTKVRNHLNELIEALEELVAQKASR